MYGIDVSGHQGTGYRNPYFAQQYNGSYNRGFIRGAYHFALPNVSSGAAQANFFSNSQASMGAWIRDFSNTYKARWNKYPAIYTTTNWWSTCVGNQSFAGTNPLWVARYASTVGALPYNWSFYTVWQYSSTPIDQNQFNGDYNRLVVFATNHD